MGNLLQVSQVAAGKLAIFAWAPSHGAAGTPVTIYGQAFSTNPAANTVSFNGIAALVTSATATQLVTSVPSGASTGPIQVTIGSQAARSATSFVVDGTGIPPLISQVSPLVVVAGDKVTVSGTHLDPVQGATTVSLGGAQGQLSAVSDTQLQFAVPANAGSGQVTVQTPYGQNVSTSTVLVLPSGYSAAKLADTGYAAINGSAAKLTIGAGGQTGAITFIATASSWLSLQASSIVSTANNLRYSIYGLGNQVIASGIISASSPSIHLPQLRSNGTYVALFTPDTDGATLTIAVKSDATLASGGTATASTTVPGQSTRVLFSATAGQTLALDIVSATTIPANSYIYYTVYSPNGAIYTTSNISGNGLINLPNLSAAGTYQVLIAPGTTVTGAIQLKLVLGITGTVPTTGTSQSYAATAPGQNVYLSFTATQGQNLELTLNNASVVGASSNAFYVAVYGASGNQVASYYCYPTSPGASCLQHLWYLAAGKYSVVVTPTYGGTLKFNALLSADIAGPAVVAGGVASLNLSAGQVERLSFAGTVGGTLALNITGVSTNPTGQNVTFLVYRPDTGAITTATPVYTSLRGTGDGIINLSNLPVTGTYTVIAVPDYGLPATAKFGVVAGATGTVPTTGTSQSYAATAPGQNVYLSFTATQGQNLELTLNNASVVGASSNAFYVAVYGASGNQVASYYCYPTNPGASCLQHLWYLAAGKYSVVVTPTYGGTLKFNALLSADIAGPAVVAGGVASLNLSAGQVERLSFAGTVGGTLALNITGVSTNPTGQNVTFLVYRPDTGAITTATPVYTSLRGTGDGIINLSNLPVTGTYTVIAVPDYGLPATAKFGVVAGATGTVPTTGTSQSYAATAPGQNVYLSFTATQGQNLELTLNNASVVGASSNAFYVAVYGASGNQVASYYCYPTNPGASCLQHLWYLAAGKYSVVVTPTYGGTLKFNALLSADIAGPAVVAGGVASLNLSAGQVERLSFAGTVGGTLALNITGVSTNPTGQNVTFLVYRPDTGAITTATPVYTSLRGTGDGIINLSNLPVTGTYTVIAVPDYGLPATAKFGVVAGATGTVPTTGTSQSYAATAPGQNVYLSFTATQGQNLELTLNNASVVGASSNAFYVAVYGASGNQVASYYCYPTNPGASCLQHLWYLAAGKYSVVVTPTYGGTLKFNALLSADISGPALALGGAASVNLAAGQVERLTFTASVGATVSLQASAVATSPTGQGVSFYIYRPDDTGTISNNTPSYSYFRTTGAQQTSLAALPVSGTYTVIAIPDYGLVASAKLGLVSNTAGTPPTYGTPTLPSTGAPQSEGSTSAGQSVTMTFNATQGQNLELTLSNLSVTGSTSTYVSLNVYNAEGGNIGSTNCYTTTAASCRLALWNLPAGTYSAVVTPPNTSSTISFSAVLTPDVVGPALTANQPATVTLGSGQVQRVTFNGTLGSTVALQLSGVTTTPAGQYVYVNVYRPDSGGITTSNAYTSFQTTTSTTVNLPNLPATGTYTLVIYTTSGAPATMQIAEYVGATGTLSSTGTSQTVSPAGAGENAYLSFTATQGQNLELTLSNLGITGSTSTYVTLNVYSATGVSEGYAYCYTTTAVSCRLGLWNLPAGTYSAVVTPPNTSSTISFNAMLKPDVVGPALIANEPATVTLGSGQVQRVTFNGTLGSTVALQLSGVTTMPAGQYVYVNVYRPDSGAITTTNAYTSFQTTTSTTVNLPNLPATGTYTLVIYTTSGAPATMQIAEYVGATGTLSSTGTSQTVSPAGAGENAYLSFTATQGQNLELTLSNLGITGSTSTYVTLNVYSATGVSEGYAYCYTTTAASCRLGLWNLPAGTYSAVVTPPNTSSTISFNAMLKADVVGPALIANEPATVTLGSGQVQRVTFNGTLGSTVALQLSGVTTTPAGQSVYVNVYRPDSGAITTTNAYTSFQTTTSTTVNLPNLPATGVYTLVIYTTSGAPATMQVAQFNGAKATVSTNGTALTASPAGPGENVYLSFTATQGQNLELALSNLGITGSTSTYVSMSVYNAAGGNVGSTNCYTSTSANCRLALWNLPAGTYSAVVAPPNTSSTISFTATLQPDIAGPALTANMPVVVKLGTGQLERLKFNGTLDNSIALQLSGITTMPAGQYVYVNVYRPDTGAITTSNYYTSFQTSTSTTVNLSNLPASGTYTLAVFTDAGIPATAQLALVGSTSGTLSTAGSPSYLTASVANQPVTANFAVTAGQNLELTLSKVSAAGGSANGFQVNVYNPSGSNVASFVCNASSPGASCSQSLWNLVAGKYTMAAAPIYGGTISFVAQLSPDLAGPTLAASKASTVTLAAGQAERLKFVGTAGGKATLQLAGVTTTPSGQPLTVRVYRPDVTPMTTSNQYQQFDTASSNTLSLRNLPVTGTYTLIVTSSNGLPATAQMTYVP